MMYTTYAYYLQVRNLFLAEVLRPLTEAQKTGITLRLRNEQVHGVASGGGGIRLRFVPVIAQCTVDNKQAYECVAVQMQPTSK